MSRRRRKASRQRAKLWLWILGAGFGGAALYYALYRGSSRGPIPIPGESAPAAAHAEPESRGGTSAPAPREEIRKSDRDALDRVLREHAR